MMTDNVDCIIITLEDEPANDADISSYTASVIEAYGQGRTDRAQFLYREKFKGEFSIVVMAQDNIIADCFYGFEIVPVVGDNCFELTIVTDPKMYNEQNYVFQLTVLALNLTELNHMFGHFIRVLACDLTIKRD